LKVSYLFVLILLTAFLQSAEAQKNRFKKGGVVELDSDSITRYSESDIFEFPNINKVLLYSDKGKMDRIRQLDASMAERELYAALREYVRNFGIENFRKNTNMIWRLAKLSEKFGPKGESILLYRLVLKHHNGNVDLGQVRKEYDTLNNRVTDLYVPLKEYFELVAYRKEIDTLTPPQGVLIRMDDYINSMQADYGPTIGNVDYLLLFTSKRNKHETRGYDEDLFFTVKIDGQWMEAQEFSTINSKYNEGSACLSKDGKYLYFARCNSPDALGNCDIFQAQLKSDSTWGNVKNLGPNVNSTSWDSQPSLSHSGDTLFFASDRLGGFGNSDIYYTVRDRKGNWSKAQNLGAVVNTRGHEVSPFFHHKFNVLYFSSNGQPVNFGDFDIYKSYRDRGYWAEPKNIGPLVNGPGSEYYFTIDSESKQLYYARSDENEISNLDLHSFPVPMEAQPEAVVTLKGTLINSETKKPFKGIVSIIDLDQGVEVAPKFLRPDGSYDFQLINKRHYLLIIQGDDFFRIEEVIFMDGDMELNKEAEPIESKIAFQSLEFEHGKSDILERMHGDLDKLANFMIDHPSFKLKISGHTDSKGSQDANLRLSQARADAIKAYLIYQFKIAPERIEAEGYGSLKPIVNEVTDEDRKLNRRVEFEISRQ